MFKDDKTEFKSILNEKLGLRLLHFDSTSTLGNYFSVSENFIQITFPIDTTDQVSDQVSDQVKHLILNLIKGNFSVNELMEKMELKHKPTFRENYIFPAVDFDLIEKTIPESPNSPKQKYRLTNKGKHLVKTLSEKENENK